MSERNPDSAARRSESADAPEPPDRPPFKVAFLATWPRVYAFVLISQVLVALGLWLLSEAAS
jgi:hypothetical protein